MARLFVTGINLNKNELQNARIQNLNAAPSSPVEGQIYHNTVDHTLYFFNGIEWIPASGSAEVIQDVVSSMIQASNGITATYFDSPGTLELSVDTSVIATKSSVDNLTTDNVPEGLDAPLGQGRKYFTDQRAVSAVAGLNNPDYYALTEKSGKVGVYKPAVATELAGNIGSGLIVNPLNIHSLEVDTTVIATRSYVDSAVSGLYWKQAVNLLASTNVDLGSTVWPIDGHNEPSSEYRILLTGQAVVSENGIWTYSPTTGWARPADADTYNELIGAAVYVMEGTQFGGTSWVQGNHYMASFGDQEWTQFSGAGTVTAGTGITVDGLEVSVNRTATDTWYDAAGSAMTVQGNLETHGDNTTTHGVTGNIVGTTDTQTLSNKTLVDPTVTVALTMAETMPIFLTNATGAFTTFVGNSVGATHMLISGTTNGQFDGSYPIYTYSATDFALQTPGAPEGITNWDGIGTVTLVSYVTVSSTELAQLDGVSSNIQTQLNAKTDKFVYLIEPIAPYAQSEWYVYHGLGNTDVIVQIYDSSNNVVEADITSAVAAGTPVVIVNFATALTATDVYKVVVIG